MPVERPAGENSQTTRDLKKKKVHNWCNVWNTENTFEFFNHMDRSDEDGEHLFGARPMSAAEAKYKIANPNKFIET